MQGQQILIWVHKTDWQTGWLSFWCYSKSDRECWVKDSATIRQWLEAMALLPPMVNGGWFDFYVSLSATVSITKWVRCMIDKPFFYMRMSGLFNATTKTHQSSGLLDAAETSCAWPQSFVQLRRPIRLLPTFNRNRCSIGYDWLIDHCSEWSISVLKKMLHSLAQRRLEISRCCDAKLLLL